MMIRYPPPPGSLRHQRPDCMPATAGGTGHAWSNSCRVATRGAASAHDTRQLPPQAWPRAASRMVKFAKWSRVMMARRCDRGGALLALRRRLVLRRKFRVLLRYLAARAFVLRSIAHWRSGPLARAWGRWKWTLVAAKFRFFRRWFAWFALRRRRADRFRGMKLIGHCLKLWRRNADACKQEYDWALSGRARAWWRRAMLRRMLRVARSGPQQPHVGAGGADAGESRRVVFVRAMGAVDGGAEDGRGTAPVPGRAPRPGPCAARVHAPHAAVLRPADAALTRLAPHPAHASGRRARGQGKAPGAVLVSTDLKHPPQPNTGRRGPMDAVGRVGAGGGEASGGAAAVPVVPVRGGPCGEARVPVSAIEPVNHACVGGSERRRRRGCGGGRGRGRRTRG